MTARSEPATRAGFPGWDTLGEVSLGGNLEVFPAFVAYQPTLLPSHNDSAIRPPSTTGVKLLE